MTRFGSTAFYQSSDPDFLQQSETTTRQTCDTASPIIKALKNMTRQNEYAGVAALAITESLMLAINDANLLPEKEILGVLRDAEDTHLNAMGKGGDDVMH